MKWLITAVGFVLLLVSPMFAGEHSALARVTVYWHGEDSGANAAWNGARLREGHCAVDPKKIPYGSKVVFHDAERMAVDSGPDVVNCKAAWSCGYPIKASPKMNLWGDPFGSDRRWSSWFWNAMPVV